MVMMNYAPPIEQSTPGFANSRVRALPDDDELLVRASAVLKSQGPENWSHGRPGLLRARTNSRSVRDASCGKIRRGGNRRWGGVMWRRRSGVLVVFFSFVNGGEGPVTAHKKRFVRAKAPTFAG